MITDITTKKGELKNAKALVKAVHWLDIQEQMKDLSFKQFKEVVFPMIQHFQAIENGEE